MFGFKKQIKIEVVDRIKNLRDYKFKKGIDEKMVSAVKDSVGKKEFRKRYFIGRITSITHFIAMTIALYILITSSSIISTLVCIGVSALFLILFLKVNYELWRARLVAKEWGCKGEVLTTTYNQYLNAVMTRPIEILPINMEL